MPLRDELARFVAQRCAEIGLSEERLAKIADVDLHVIEQLLARDCFELDVEVAERIANSVGLAVGVLGQRRTRRSGTAARNAAQGASTSYRDVLTPDVLVQTIMSGVVPQRFRPHIRALLDEVPIGTLANLAYDLQDEFDVPAAHTWKTMRALAVCLGCCREIWH